MKLVTVDEFRIIDEYFAKRAGKRKDVRLGIGDDCAVLKMPPERELAVSIDSLVEGVHFFKGIPPYYIGYKSLAVSLSDMAAIGAEPAWVTLALTMPRLDKSWLKEFSAGFFSLLDEYSLQLVGGNISRGPLNITTELHGFLPPKEGLRRSGAKAGDLIYVTGDFGDTGLLLKMLHPSNNFYEVDKILMEKLYKQTPRVNAGLALRSNALATSAIDVSDGLAADLGHILESSNVGATIYVEKIPLSTWLKSNTSRAMAYEFALTAGDDYELCFTVTPDTMGTDGLLARSSKKQQKLNAIAKKCGCNIQCIGRIESRKGLRIKNADGTDFHLKRKDKGYSHKWQYKM